MAKDKKKFTQLVGIDLSSTAVKVLQLGKVGDRLRLEAYAIEPLEPDAIKDSLIQEGKEDSVIEAIKKALKRANVKTKSAAVAVGGAGVQAKVIQIPDVKNISEDDLEQQVLLEAANHIPFPLDEGRLDFVVLGKSEKAAELLDVLLVVARREQTDQLQSVIEAAGMKVEVMDVESVVMENTFRLLQQQLKLDQDAPMAMVDIGAQQISFRAMKGGHTIYARDQNFETIALLKEISKQTGVSLSKAKEMLQQRSWPSGFEEEHLEPFRENLVATIKRLINTCISGTDVSSLDQVLLVGGGSMTPGLCEALEEGAGIRVIQANPLTHIGLGSGMNAMAVNEDASALFLACGLAMRSFES